MKQVGRGLCRGVDKTNRHSYQSHLRRKLHEREYLKGDLNTNHSNQRKANIAAAEKGGERRTLKFSLEIILSLFLCFFSVAL